MKQFYRSIQTMAALLLAGTLSAQVSYTFTNAGATGQYGPSQAQVNTEYTNTNLAGAVTVTSGIQEWTVPSGGLYRIEAFGAQGGTGGSKVGGKGAHISGEFLFSSGTTLEILVGQQGVWGQSGQAGGGGGGGTYVVDANTGDPLVIAGGGSGCTDLVDGNPGLAGESGDAGDGCASNGGTNGNGGGSALNCGGGTGGGGGFFTDGSNTGSWGWQYGKGYANGGAGGDPGNGIAYGGFGGGAGTHTFNTGGGPGGGYSGGGAPNHGNSWAGGGGGSFNDGDNPLNIADVNEGHGYVVITQLGSNSPNEAGVTGIINPSFGSCAGTYAFEVEVFNFGNNQITTVDIDWSINGGAVQSQTYSGTLDTFGGIGNPSAIINLGSLTISGNTNIKVWTTMPNGQNDTVNDNDTINISYYASNPQIDLGNVALCNGSFELINLDSPEWDSYQWSTGSTAPQIVITTPGTYGVTAIDTFGCPASDSAVVVNGVTPVVNMGNGVEGCDFAVLNSGTPNGVYNWSNGATSQTITVTESGNYFVTVVSQDGCEGSGGVNVVIHESPEIDLGPNASICVDLGEVHLLGVPNNFANYQWNTGQSSNSILVSGNQGYPMGGNDFFLTVVDENGCTDTDTARVTLKACIPEGIANMDDEQGFVVYPNPATEVFTIQLSESIGNAKIELYDVTGRLVMSKSSTTGTTLDFNVSAISAGTYQLKVSGESESFVQTVVVR